METYSEYVRRRHYELQRRARSAMGIRLCHTRVRPTSGVGHNVWSQCGRRATRTCYRWDRHYDYPEGHVVFWCPERPTFRAMVMYEQCSDDDGDMEWDEVAFEIVSWQSSHSGRMGCGESAGGRMVHMPYVLSDIQRYLRVI